MRTTTATRLGGRAAQARRHGSFATACVLTLLTLAGCAPDVNAAVAAAEDFNHAVGASDWASACSLLSDDTREKAAQDEDSSCEDRLRSLHLQEEETVTGAEIYGRNAIVDFENDSVFLTSAESGWHITAAGCTPNGDAPYTCEVGGK